MDGNAWIAVLAAAGTLITAVAAAVVLMWNTRRTNKAADRKDAYDELYKLYVETKTEVLQLRDRHTSLLLKTGELKQVIGELRVEIRHLRGQPVTDADLYHPEADDDGKPETTGC